MKSFFLYIVLFLFALQNIEAEDISFRASAKNKVVVGERFQYTFTINSQGTNFRGPDFKGFRILTGPNLSTSQNYSIVQGKMSQSVNVTYSYVLQALSEGEFSIGTAKITIGGETYASNSLKIQVLPRAGSSQGNTRSPKAAQNSQDQQKSEDNNDVYIKAFLNKSNPYQGQQIIVTYKIFTQLPISDLSIDKSSSFSGFWSKDLLKNNSKLKQYSEYINGKEYIVADLNKIALFPQKSGKLTVDPMELRCVAQVRKEGQRRTRDPFFDSFFNDPFFNNMYQNVELVLESNTLNVNVKPLPAENKPSNFSGAVGKFQLRSTIDKTELKANEPITLKFIVSGSGNLELINDLGVSFPPDFETYEPKIINNIRANNSGVSGSRTFEYLVIPRNAGDFTIDPVKLSYFDPAKKEYTTLTTPSYNIKVKKGEGNGGTISYSGVTQADIQYIGSDIRHIKSMPFKLHMGYSLFLGSDLFFILLAAPVILFILVMIIWRRNIKFRENEVLVRNKRATKVARKNLKKALEYLKAKQDKNFYLEISRALWGYLSDKFNIPLSELSTESVILKLEGQNINESLVNEFIETLEHTEYARFAPGDPQSKMNEIYDEAIKTITKIERELKH